MSCRGPRGAATLAVLAALALTACGRAITANPVEARLAREDLVAVARALRSCEPAVQREVAATRAAWPLLVDGIPARVSASARTRILAAAIAGQALPLPALLAEPEAGALTGPASPLAGRYRDFQQLSSAGWRQIAADLGEIEHGPPRAARFARETVALDIEGVYDAHYSIAEVGKQVASAYKALGGAPVLGGALGAGEVQQLTESYSRSRDRLLPHERVKLGS